MAPSTCTIFQSFGKTRHGRPSPEAPLPTSPEHSRPPASVQVPPARQPHNSGSGSSKNLFFCGAVPPLEAERSDWDGDDGWAAGGEQELLRGLPREVGADILARVDRASLPALRGVCRSWKAFVEGREFRAARRRRGTAEEWVFIVGEVRGQQQPQLLAFDPAAARYYHLSSLPPKLFSPPLSLGGGKVAPMQRQDFGLVALSEELVVFGAPVGKLFGKRAGGVWLYSTVRNRWRRGAEMPTARSGFACGAIAGKVYVAGGRDRTGVAMTSAEVYDPQSDTWEALPSMATAKHICTGAVVGGKLHVLGCGDQWRCQPQNLLQPVRMEVYDPTQRAWSTLALECPAPKVWGVPWHDQASPVAWQNCLYWVGCGALKLRFYDAAANAFVGYFENELCAYDEHAKLSGFLHGPPAGLLQARESCGLAVARGELLVLGGCLFDPAGLPTLCPPDVQVHTPRAPAGEAWRTLCVAAPGPRLGKVWRCVTAAL